MRDLFVTVVVFGSLPIIFARPWTGIIMWSWLGYMNPHRLTWGFAYTLPFAQIVALTLLAGLLFSKEKKKLIWSREMTILAVFIGWMILTAQFALEPAAATQQLDKVLKVQLMTFVTLIVIQSKERVNALIWIIALSLGLYGIKGGIFTILTGGAYHVYGPSGSFIGDNNSMGLALLMVLPLMRYLQVQTQRHWVKLGLTAAMGLTFVSILGTQSRGAYVGAIVTGTYLLMKSPKKLTFLLLVLLIVPPALSIMPQSWWDRMGSIQTYQEDDSAMGRISAWRFATQVASHRVTGGGYECFQRRWFQQFSPGPVHDAHSIWFEVLGEHGFPGLFLFISLGTATWLTSRRIIRRARSDPDIKWAADLAAMIQVSLVAYASTGTFLGLAYFDLFYHLVVVTAILAYLVRPSTQPVIAPNFPSPRELQHA